jgi:hypothetical protein
MSSSPGGGWFSNNSVLLIAIVAVSIRKECLEVFLNVKDTTK